MSQKDKETVKRNQQKIQKEEEKKVEEFGFEPRVSSMLSRRFTD